MPQLFTVHPRKPKPLVPPIEEWQNFPLAKLEEHWMRAANPVVLRTTGKGYVCKMLTDDSCSHFVKKKSFLDHMRSVHRMNPEDCPIGRPRTSTRQRNPPTTAAAEHNRESTMGSFPGKVWKHKKNRLLWLLRWAQNLKVAGIGDATTWVLNKATERYVEWRNSEDFQKTLNSVYNNTKSWWLARHPDIDLEDLQTKASLPEDLADWASDDGMPEVDLDRSNLDEMKITFKNRIIKEKAPEKPQENKTPAKKPTKKMPVKKLAKSPADKTPARSSKKPATKVALPQGEKRKAVDTDSEEVALSPVSEFRTLQSIIKVKKSRTPPTMSQGPISESAEEVLNTLANTPKMVTYTYQRLKKTSQTDVHILPPEIEVAQVPPLESAPAQDPPPHTPAAQVPPPEFALAQVPATRCLHAESATSSQVSVEPRAEQKNIVIAISFKLTLTM